MPTIYIENKPYAAAAGQNLLAACVQLGFELPYFCYHPVLHAVGACRQCAVKQFKDETDARGKIVMACMTPVTEGARISIADPEARAFRAGIIELLMTNHPHDCPVCDEGGECHLQDMTVLAGHVNRQFRFRKRTHRNQDLGPFINHEMNRCIQCYRCVRFYRDYAGGRDLDVFGAASGVYFGRCQEGPLENEFSGNLVEICPTGVFTDKTFSRHYTRKWDLQSAPSVCFVCGVGCNILAGERYGVLRRITNRFHPDINGYFLCDRGRFGYEFVNAAGRIKQLSAKHVHGPEMIPADVPTVVSDVLAPMLHSAQGLIGIGSPRASLEANMLLRELVGADHFFAAIPACEHRLVEEILAIYRATPAHIAALSDMAAADGVLLIGEDITATAPMMALMVRQAVKNRPQKAADALKIPAWQAHARQNAVQQDSGFLYIAAPYATRLDGIATGISHATPATLASMLQACADLIAGETLNTASCSQTDMAAAQAIAAGLIAADRPLLIAGVSGGSIALLRATDALASALSAHHKAVELAFAIPQVNSLGLQMLGARALDDAAQVEADSVLILESDLFAALGREHAELFCNRFRQIILIDHTISEMASRADVVVPAATWAESSGTVVNYEGRAQHYFQVFQPASPIAESRVWLAQLCAAMLGAEAPVLLSDQIRALSRQTPAFAALADMLVAWQSIPLHMKIPRQTQRVSGRTAVDAASNVHEPGRALDRDTPFAFSMEGSNGPLPAALTPRYWLPGWNSVQALPQTGALTGVGAHDTNYGVRLLPGSMPKGAAATPLPRQEEPGVGRGGANR